MAQLRIVGGRLRGRRFAGPVGDVTRPTSDRVREAIASVLESRDVLADAYVLDLFAGTGALAFEALSRGARHAVLVDQHAPCLRAMRQSAAQLGVNLQVDVVRCDLLRGPARVLTQLDPVLREPVDLLFADPPYARVEALPGLLASLADAGKLASGALAVVEHAHGAAPVAPEGFTRLGAYRYGDTGVTLWSYDGTRKDAA